MAEEYHQTGTVCSGASWWDIARSAGAGSSGFDSSAGQAASATVSSMSCSTGVDEMSVAGFGGWSAAGRGSAAASCGEESSAASASGSSVTFQDTNTAHRAAASLSMGFLMDSSPVAAGGFGVSFPNSIEHWNQSLLGRGQGNCGGFQAMLQQEDAMCASKPYQHMNNSNTQHQAQFGSAGNEPIAIGQQHQVVESYPVASAAASHDSGGINLLRGLVDPAAQYEVRQPLQQQQQLHSHDNSNGSWWLSGNEQQQYSSNSRFVSPPPHHMHQVKQQPVVQTLQFVNSAPYWGNTIGQGAAAAPYSSQAPTQYLAQAMEAAARPSINTSTTVISTKQPSSGASLNTNKNTSRSSGNEQSPASFKKARVDAPSSAPAFKSLQVRKEKLGDRITALQQLVSPFGKTDTASVLFEAIEYIKFLHEQVLCTPYLKNGPPMQQQNQNADKSKDGEVVKPDLRSRGLCLVPISSTFPVANEPTADFWTPTFGGSYR